MKSKIVALIVLLILTFTAVVGLVSSSQAADDLDEFIYLPLIEKSDELPTPFPTVTPTATSTPFPTAVLTATPKPMATATAVPPSDCTVCSYDAYNCSDFSTHNEAQACHDYCFAQVGYDVHRLDFDDDGLACESLP